MVFRISSGVRISSSDLIWKGLPYIRVTNAINVLTHHRVFWEERIRGVSFVFRMCSVVFPAPDLMWRCLPYIDFTNAVHISTHYPEFGRKGFVVFRIYWVVFSTPGLICRCLTYISVTNATPTLTHHRVYWEERIRGVSYVFSCISTRDLLGECLYRT